MLNNFKDKIKNFSNDENGSVIIESIIVIPFIIIVIFMISQIFVYYYSNNVMNTATNDAANTVSYQLRGNPILVEAYENNFSNFNNGSPFFPLRDAVKETINERVDNTTESNNFILFSKNFSGEELDLKEDIDF